MKRVFFPDKSYSYLQLPVTRLKGCPTATHLTLKFFGEASIDPWAIEKRVPIDPALPADELSWEPRFWSSPVDHASYYVLAFTEYPKILEWIHNQFDIVKDQYIPWTPHITVPKAYFLLVEDQGFTPQDCELEFGEIELCLGGPNL